MATNTGSTKTPELFTIEELKEKNKTPEAIFQGARAAEGWRPGKMVSEEEYQKALDGFLKRPMNGKEVKKDAKRR